MVRSQAEGGHWGWARGNRIAAEIVRHPDWLGAAVIILLLALAVIAVGPIHNFPVEDDWDYSRMVKIFVETGRLQRSDYAQATLIFPAVYGGVVSKLFGFSFTTLRLSTLALALLALLGFYFLLAELGFTAGRRILGTLALLVTPVFVYLAFSFMTDVPSLCWTVIAMLFYVRSIKRRAPSEAVIGAACAALAFLTRQTGLFIPIAFAIVALWRLPRTTWLRFLAAGCVLPVGVIALYLWLDRNSVGNWATQNITLSLTAQQLAQPEWWGIFVRRAVQTAMTVGLYLSPLMAAVFFGAGIRPKWRPLRLPITRGRAVAYAVLAVIFAVAVTRLALRGEWFPYLTDILTRAGLRPYLAFVAWDAGALRADIFPPWLLGIWTIFAAILGLALAFAGLQRINRRWPRDEAPELQFVLLLTFLIAGSSLVFATFYERYLLPLLPGAIIILLAVAQQRGFSVRAGALALVPLALFSWLLMQDYWSWNEARWQVGRELLAQSIPAAKIDAGYEWDGWYLYDATVDYIRSTGKPFIFDPWQYVLDPEYVLAFQPMKNYRVERVIDFPTPFGAGEFYLQRRE